VNGALVVVYEEKLVAFVASGAADSSSNEVFAKLLMGALKSENSSLTSYMIPSHILVMEEFPLTLNGKIDRKCLMAGLVDLGEEGFATETESRPLVVGSIKSNIGHLEGAA
jgi:acyl-CoA synthetase (AMP-forming)/AMP-acid ligase II